MKGWEKAFWAAAPDFRAKIKTSHVYPPIPVRQFDWCAFYDGTEESGNYGYGRTEAEAIKDLIMNYEPVSCE